MDAIHDSYKNLSLQDYLSAIRDETDKKIQKMSYDESLRNSRKEGIDIGVNQGIGIGEVKGIKETMINIFKSMFGFLSFEVRFRINNSSKEELELLQKNISHIKEEKDILYILNHKEYK